MLYKILSIAVFFIFSQNYLYSENIIKTITFNGDCNDSDTTLHYAAITYLHVEVDTLNMSRTSTKVGVNICNSPNLNVINILRDYYSPVYKFEFNSNQYTIDTSQIKFHLVFHDYDTTSNQDIYIFEIRDKSTNQLLAIDYGSQNEGSCGRNYSYFLILDSSNPYASQYIGANLTYTQIFLSGDSYYWEITDDDRDDLLVGFKYKSKNSPQVFEKVFVPNP